MLVVAHQWRLLERKESKYTSWQWRFMQRFRSFQNIANPPLLQYDEFLRVLSMGMSAGGGAGGGAGAAAAEAEAQAQGAHKALCDNGQVGADVSLSRRVLRDAETCFSSARTMLADAKKSNPAAPSDVMSLELVAPLFKVRKSALGVFYHWDREVEKRVTEEQGKALSNPTLGHVPLTSVPH